ncbi:hypothetical protein FKG94_06800 [Exilibacterium tricleocarpae]|uniref:DUF1585 domain-containing protein n=2 Tax=Exilibacterium tricleocarpae TaxID=2591008 RepID=A0A545TZT3_9GAMM|nr:hypothetical protein [Exilibacterium tricleocarpae]TQV82724.1 hypothetical protein FKG94_06800 [Exilibacterium tricleocarpae]
MADIREQAKRIHDRLTGVAPSQALLDAMVADITASNGGANASAGAGHGVAAALRAIDNGDGDEFYSVTLKNMATPWTNRDQTVFAPLNDYTATYIGMVRDELDLREMLYADIIYTANTGNAAVQAANIPAYSNSNNRHYEQFENSGLSFSDPNVLARGTQSSVTGLAAPAGVMTTRGAAKSFFVLGTNRAMFRFTLMSQLCVDLEQVHDITLVPDRIRQDVTRSPGGDSTAFLNGCVGCHNGMDPLTQAFAYYNYNDPDGNPDTDDGSLEYTPGVVQPKYLINEANFTPGYITENDNWANYWREGQNRSLGWDPALSGSGTGAASMGMELAHSEAFAQCQVKKVFNTVCLRDADSTADVNKIDSMVTGFKANGYNLKQVFAETADYCMGE